MAKNIEEVHKVLNNTKKEKSKINMIIKSPFQRQIIVSMSSTNSDRFIALLSKHITNINRTLKNIKSEVVVDFIYKDYRGLVIITTNKVIANSDLNTIENYIKNVGVMTSIVQVLSQNLGHLLLCQGY